VEADLLAGLVYEGEDIGRLVAGNDSSELDVASKAIYVIFGQHRFYP
jgi:hypothetical protein